jgi:hypothetical protein
MDFSFSNLQVCKSSFVILGCVGIPKWYCSIYVIVDKICHYKIAYLFQGPRQLVEQYPKFCPPLSLAMFWNKVKRIGSLEMPCTSSSLHILTFVKTLHLWLCMIVWTWRLLFLIRSWKNLFVTWTTSFGCFEPFPFFLIKKNEGSQYVGIDVGSHI